MKRVPGSPILALAAFGCAAFCASAAWAAKPQPAPQWAVDAAQTPTPAIAKNAAAAILMDEYTISVDEANRAVERERYAVRILKPQGRRYAHCEAEYDIDEKLNYFHSWTIGADGKQFQAMPADFADVGAYDAPILQFSERIRELNPPGADPGAVVVCETEELLQPYMREEMWQVQHSIPAINQSLELDLAPGGHYADSWHRFPPVKPVELAGNRLRWEVKEMPALDLENIHAAPDWWALAARASIHWGDTAIRDRDAQWRAIGQWMGQLEEHRPDPTPEIAAKAQELTAGAPDLYTKLSRITDYIQKNVRYFVVLKGIGGWQAHPAGDIFRNRYGDCKDKTTLLISMLQAVGIHAHYFAVDHRRGFVDPEAPSHFSDHMITAIEVPEGESDPRLMAKVKATNGKTLLLFDPTDEQTPVGLLRAALQGGWGFIANGAESQALRMPLLPPESAGKVRKGSFTLAADGSLSGDIAMTFTGDDAETERSFIKYNDTKSVREKLESSLGGELPGVVFKGYEFHMTGDLDKPLDLNLHLSATDYAHASGPLLLLRPRVLGTHTRFAPEVMEGKPRKYPIEMGHPGRWHDIYEIALPEGYAVDELPDPVDVDMDFASYHSKATAKAGQLRYEREYVLRQVEIPATRAADFRKLESLILLDEKGTAVLKKQ
jgi:hypothetical protein